MKILVLAATVLVLDFSSAYACTILCDPISVAKGFLRSTAVFEGRVVSISKVDLPCTTYGTYTTKYFFTFEIEKAWKGITSKYIVIESSREQYCPNYIYSHLSFFPLCSSRNDFFSITSSTYIVFAQNYDGVLSSSICGPKLSPLPSSRRFLDSMTCATTSRCQSSEQIAYSSVTLYPNPSKDIVTLSYNLHDAADVSAELFDVQGRSVRIITPPEYQTAGSHYVQVDVRNLALGMYMCRLRMGNKTVVRQIAVTA
jgi:hypothetical protein